MTGTGLPLNTEAVDSARASALPTNSPVAQTPLAPERRNPSNLVLALSNASINSTGLGCAWATQGAEQPSARITARVSGRERGVF